MPRALMRGFVQRQREAGEYETFLQRKVIAARSSVRANLGLANEDVEKEFAARRTAATIGERSLDAERA